MNDKNDIVISEIQEAITGGKVVPVIGAGVSVATAKLPTWRSMVESAIEHARSTGSGELKEAWAAFSANDLTQAAELATAALGAERSTWLRRSFHRERRQISSRALIDRICDLQCPLIATTNYDRLLTLLHPEKWEPVTWTDPIGMQTALREGHKILHLHGVFDQPDSVILGSASYVQLSSKPAYEAVARALWMERSLLFIGCSIDGIEDPDFSGLLDWAARTFGATPYKHYAVLQSGTFSMEQQQDYLQRYRLQLLPFGKQFADLPGKLHDLNPNAASAREWRLQIAKDLLSDFDAGKSGDFAEVLEGVRSTAVDLQGVATQLFQQRQQTSSYLRGQLRAFQQVICAILDPNQVKEQISLWEDDKVVSYGGAFRDAVRAANSALELIPADLLAAFKQRGIEIHQNVLSGYAQSALDECERIHPRTHAYPPAWAYSLENLKRILTSVWSILEAAPERIFPEIATAEIHERYGGPRLIVVRTDRLELRRLDRPEVVVATLRMPPALGRDAAVVKLAGNPALVTYDTSSLLAWQPDRANEPFAELLVNEPYGINSVVSRSTPEGLQTFVLTTSGPVYELLDMKLQRRWSPVGNDFLHYPVLTPEGTLYAFSGHNQFQLFQIEPGGSATLRITAKHVPGWFAGLPAFAEFWTERLGEEQERAREIESDREQPNFQLAGADWCDLGALVLDIQINFLNHNDSALLLLDPATLAPNGYVYIRDQNLSSFRFTKYPDGSPCLVITLLSDFEQSYDLVQWFRGVRTKKGWIFVAQGSTLRTKDDLVAVAMANHSEGFAADDSGGLFSFSTEKKPYTEISRDTGSPIRDLMLFP